MIIFASHDILLSLVNKLTTKPSKFSVAAPMADTHTLGTRKPRTSLNYRHLILLTMIETMERGAAITYRHT